MTGLFRILLFIFFGYVLMKTFRYIFSIFSSVSAKREEQQVYQTRSSSSKIDKKDIVDAKFEEIKEDDPS